jgi:hypothetical protein
VLRGAAAWLLLCVPALAANGYALASDEMDDDQAADFASYNDIKFDPNVRPAQATSGRSNRTAARSRTSRVPYMIGDSPLSGSNSSEFQLGTTYFDSFGDPLGSTPLVRVDQPNLATRLNIAEGNTALPEDRFIFSYRHFTNAIDASVLGTQNFLNLDQWVVGFEKTFLNELGSLAIQMPFYRQLDSDLNVSRDATGAHLPIDQLDGEIGNLQGYLKVLLCRESNMAFSFGVGCSTPTADDATVRGNFDGPFVLSQNPAVQATSPSTFFFEGRFENNTVNLVPFIAWSMRPQQSALFHQGFVQVDVPLNSSEVSFRSTGTIEPDSGFGAETFDDVESDRLSQQAILRANLGLGYWICQRQGMNVAALVECHYTTNVNSGDNSSVPVTTFSDGSGNTIPLNLTAVNSGDFDVVNLTGGFAVDLGTCLITNGVAVPVVDDDRQFDMEYNLQIHQRF